MKRLLSALMFVGFSSSAFAIAPFSLPWVNHGATDAATYNTADHPNTVFVLEFFQNFCPACNDNAVNVNELATQYKNQARVQVLDVTLDTSRSEMQQWIANHNPNHPMVQDANKLVWGQIGSQYIPTTVIMDCAGKVLYQNTGAWDDAEKAAIRQQVDAQLVTNCQ